MQLGLMGRDGQPSTRGVVRFHLGDWRKAWWLWPEDAALITDPPFGISYKSSCHRGHGGRKISGVRRELATGVAGDGSTRERDEALDQPWEVAAVWGPGDLSKVPPWRGQDPRAILIHDKGEGVGMGDLSIPWKPNYETICIYGRGWAGKRTTSVLRGTVTAFGAGSAPGGRIHPNQKPLTVCAELISKVPDDLPIVDPFAGSGSVLLAAAHLGREAYGAEVNPDHYHAAVALLRADGIRVIERPESTVEQLREPRWGP